MINQTPNTPANRIDQMVEHIAARAAHVAKTRARQGRENPGCCVDLGTAGQRAMRIKHPTQVTAAHREMIVAALRGRGLSVRINTQTDSKGRESFLSLTATA